jgi:ABC-type branched-subunit amino acid transport system ATPase component
MPAPVLVQDLRKRFGSRLAVDRISFSVGRARGLGGRGHRETRMAA